MNHFRGVTSLLVTHVEKCGPLIKIWGQTTQEKAEYIDAFLTQCQSQFDLGFGRVAPAALAYGQVICAKYTDGRYYRARVANLINVDCGVAFVNFIDFGNSDQIDVSNIRVIEEAVFDSLKQIPGLAIDFLLSGVVSRGTEWADDDIEYLKDLVLNQKLHFTVTGYVGSKYFILADLGGIDLTHHLIQKNKGLPANSSRQEQFLHAVKDTKRLRSSIVPASNISGTTMRRAPPPNILPENNMLPPTMYRYGAPPPIPNVPPPTRNLMRPSGEGVTTMFSHPMLAFDKLHTVKVSAVDTESLSFVVQIESEMQKVQQLTAELAMMQPVPMTRPLIPGMPCLARSLQTGALHRAVVNAVAETGYRVYYVDAGNYEILPYTSFYEIPASVLNQSALAQRFFLAGVAEMGVSDEWRQTFKKMVENKLLFLQVVRCEEYPIKQAGELYDGHQRSVKEVVNSRFQVAEFQKISLAVGIIYDVFVSTSDSPDDFTVQLAENNLETVQQVVADYCAVMEDVMNVNKIKISKACLAKFSEDQAWYRAEITAVKPGKAEVYFVDYGNKDAVPYSSLKDIPNSLVSVHPVQSFKCCLSDWNTKTTISDDEVRVFQELVIDKPLKMTVMGELVPSGHLLVNLQDPECDENVGATIDAVILAESQAAAIEVAPEITVTVQAEDPAWNAPKEQARTVNLTSSAEKDGGWDQTGNSGQEFSNQYSDGNRHNTRSGGSYGDHSRGGNGDGFAQSETRGRKWEDGDHRKKWDGSDDRGGGKRWESSENKGGRRWGGSEDKGRKNWNNEEESGGGKWESSEERGNRKWETSEDRGAKKWETSEDRKPRKWDSSEDRGSRKWDNSEDRGGRKWDNSEDRGGRKWDNSEDRGGRKWENSDDRPKKWGHSDDRAKPWEGFEDRAKRPEGSEDRGKRWEDREDRRKKWDNSEDRGRKWEGTEDRQGKWGNSEDRAKKWESGGDWRTNSDSRGKKWESGDGSSKNFEERGKRRENADGRAKRWEGGDRQNNQSKSYGSEFSNTATENTETWGAEASSTASAYQTETCRSLVASGSYTPVTVQIGTTTYVNFAHCDDPHNVWLQLKSSEEELSQLMEQIAAVYDGENPPSSLVQPVVGTACIARYAIDQGWYRAVVQSVDFGTVDVHFVDYGNRDIATETDVREVQPAFLTLPAQAVRCRLHLTQPKNPAAGWSEEEVNEVFTLAEGASLQAKFVAQAGELYDIILKDDDKKLNINEKFGAGVTVVLPGDTIQDSAPTRLHPPVVPVGSEVEVNFSHCDDIENMWLQLKSSEAELAQLMEDIAAVYDADDAPPVLNQPAAETPCVARYPADQGWYRAVVESTESGTVNVHFVDYGNRDAVCEADVREAQPSVLTLPAQAIKCRLYMARPRDPAVGWSEEEVNEMFSMAEGASLKARFISQDGDVYNIVLKDTAQDLNINQHFGAGDANTYAELSPQGAEDAIVTWFESPANFCVQCLSGQESLRALMDQIQITYIKKPAIGMTLDVGSAVIAEFSEDRVKYRASVKDVVSPSSCLVEFVDFGNTEVISKNKMWEMDPQFMTLPKQSLRCFLNYVLPPFGPEWPANSPDYDQYFDVEKLLCDFQQKSDSSWGVSLWLGEESVAQQLIAAGLAQAVSQEQEGLESVPTEVDPTPLDLSLLPGQTLKGHVTYIESISKFYVQLDVNLANHVQSLVNQHVADNQEFDPLNAQDLEVGNLCIATFDSSEWYRAKIVDCAGTAGIVVNFLDYGDTEEVQKDKMMPIPEILAAYYPQATECCVDGLPSAEPDQQLEEAFRASAEGVDLLVHVTRIEGTRVFTLLYDLTGEKLQPLQSLGTLPQSVNQLCPVPLKSASDSVWISHVGGPSELWVGRASEVDMLSNFSGQLNTLYTTDIPVLQPVPGALCAALSEEFGTWYRAVVVHVVEDHAEVQYIDYGNCEMVPQANLRQLHESLYATPVFVRRVALPVVTTSDKEFADACLELVADQHLKVQYYVSDATLFGAFYFEDDSSLAEKLVELGVATKLEKTEDNLGEVNVIVKEFREVLKIKSEDETECCEEPEICLQTQNGAECDVDQLNESAQLEFEHEAEQDPEICLEPQNDQECNTEQSVDQVEESVQPKFVHEAEQVPEVCLESQNDAECDVDQLNEESVDRVEESVQVEFEREAEQDPEICLEPQNNRECNTEKSVDQGEESVQPKFENEAEQDPQICLGPQNDSEYVAEQSADQLEELTQLEFEHKTEQDPKQDVGQDIIVQKEVLEQQCEQLKLQDEVPGQAVQREFELEEKPFEQETGHGFEQQEVMSEQEVQQEVMSEQEVQQEFSGQMSAEENEEVFEPKTGQNFTEEAEQELILQEGVKLDFEQQFEGQEVSDMETEDVTESQGIKEAPKEDSAKLASVTVEVEEIEGTDSASTGTSTATFGADIEVDSELPSEAEQPDEPYEQIVIIEESLESSAEGKVKQIIEIIDSDPGSDLDSSKDSADTGDIGKSMTTDSVKQSANTTEETIEDGANTDMGPPGTNFEAASEFDSELPSEAEQPDEPYEQIVIIEESLEPSAEGQVRQIIEIMDVDQGSDLDPSKDSADAGDIGISMSTDSVDQSANAAEETPEDGANTDMGPPGTNLFEAASEIDAELPSETEQPDDEPYEQIVIIEESLEPSTEGHVRQIIEIIDDDFRDLNTSANVHEDFNGCKIVQDFDDTDNCNTSEETITEETDVVETDLVHKDSSSRYENMLSGATCQAEGSDKVAEQALTEESFERSEAGHKSEISRSAEAGVTCHTMGMEATSPNGHSDLGTATNRNVEDEISDAKHVGGNSEDSVSFQSESCAQKDVFEASNPEAVEKTGLDFSHPKKPATEAFCSTTVEFIPVISVEATKQEVVKSEDESNVVVGTLVESLLDSIKCSKVDNCLLETTKMINSSGESTVLPSVVEKLNIHGAGDLTPGAEKSAPSEPC